MSTTATQAQQKAPKFGDPVAGDATPPRPVQPIPLTRMMQTGFVVGEMQTITLPEGETIEEGLQDPRRWEHVGPRLAMGQWIEVANDAGSMYRLMRVDR